LLDKRYEGLIRLLKMLGNLWTSSILTSEKLGVSEEELSDMRENGIFKPGVHWKSSPNAQMTPWNPEAVYNINLCIEIISKKESNKLKVIAAA